MWPRIATARIYIRDLLDLVAATDGEVASVEGAVRNLYDWHNRRSLAGLQLTFAPAAAAILAIVAKPGSTALVVVAGVIVAITLVLGVWQLLVLNWFHGEYVDAVRLATYLNALHAELVPYPHGMNAPSGSAAQELYTQIGKVAMVRYRAYPEKREYVLGIIDKHRVDAERVVTTPDRPSEGVMTGARKRRFTRLLSAAREHHDRPTN